MNSYIKYFILIIGISSLASCGPNYIYKKEIEIKNAQWTYADSVKYEVEILDTNKIYSLYLDVNHAATYPYQNIYMRIGTAFPKGEKIQERLSIDFADKLGRWNGDCNNRECDLRVTIQENAFFSQAGTYIFTVEQFMRKDSLPDVRSLQLAIEDTGKSR